MSNIILFIDKYIPGFEWLVFLVVIHAILSTIAHIAHKDFKFSEWPKFVYMWLLLMVGVVTINGIAAVAGLLASAALLLPIITVLQAMIYTMYFGYYLDNIFKHMNMLGLPVDPGLMEFIKSMTDKVKSNFTGGV